MSATGSYHEKILIERVALGDQGAFSLIVAHYATGIHTQLLFYLKDAQRAEEVTQDIFMVVWRYRHKLPSIDNFAGYLYVITRNRVKKELKERVMTNPLPPNDQLHEAMNSTVRQSDYKELLEAIHEVVERMPAKRKEVFKLSRFEGMTHEQIAVQLDISINTIKQHIKEALAFLRLHLAQRFGPLLFAWGSIYLSGT